MGCEQTAVERSSDVIGKIQGEMSRSKKLHLIESLPSSLNMPIHSLSQQTQINLRSLMTGMRASELKHIIT